MIQGKGRMPAGANRPIAGILVVPFNRKEEPVRIALVHYHLHQGGVTSVMLHQAEALAEAGDEVLLIAGEGPPEPGSLPAVFVEALRYDRFRVSGGSDGNGETLAGAMLRAMEAHWGREADIVHVHNPLIQKNASLLPALKILQRRGIRLFLQNHDMAEDFRPDVYSPREEYPEDCHYGVINRRDYSFLRDAGLSDGGLHLIPNEVFPIQAAPVQERSRYLYPVRVIRRKNIGEALFLSLFIPRKTTVAITLPPTTDKDGPMYRHWMGCAAELTLPMEFEAGRYGRFSEIVGSSRCVITTSVKEGFGFSFLEPWTAGRAVTGRRIDYVCRDFEEAGVRFDSLYPGIAVPAAHFPPETLYRKMEHTLTRTYRAFGMEAPEGVLQKMKETILAAETVDFGRLDEESQEGIIRAVIADRAVRRDLIAANPFLEAFGEGRIDETQIEHNRGKILSAYGRERIGGILRSIYGEIMQNRVTQKIAKPLLLERFLDPGQLFLVGVDHG
jgi:glycosyltransferase involved in cell wall biosynthesis